MIREYVEGHKDNKTYVIEEMYGKKLDSPVFVIKGCIRVDGVDNCFIAWCPVTESDYKRKTQEYFDRYIRPECTCVWPMNPEGINPPCPVHRKEQG